MKPTIKLLSLVRTEQKKTERIIKIIIHNRSYNFVMVYEWEIVPRWIIIIMENQQNNQYPME